MTNATPKEVGNVDRRASFGMTLLTIEEKQGRQNQGRLAEDDNIMRMLNRRQTRREKSLGKTHLQVRKQTMIDNGGRCPNDERLSSALFDKRTRTHAATTIQASMLSPSLHRFLAHLIPPSVPYAPTRTHAPHAHRSSRSFRFRFQPRTSASR